MTILEEPKTKSKKKTRKASPLAIKRQEEIKLHGGDSPISPASLKTSLHEVGESIVTEYTYGVVHDSNKNSILKYLDDLEYFFDHDFDLPAIEDLNYKKWVVSPRTTQEIAASLEKKSYRAKVKVKAIKTRRKQFQINKARLTLLLLDSGSEYVCNHPGCEIDEDLTIDHIYPLSRGGDDSVENLQFLCKSHNSSKGDKIQ